MGIDQQHLDFSVAHARKGDVQTSHDAAAKVVNLGRTRDAILDILKTCVIYNGLMDEKIVEIYRKRVESGLFDIPAASESGIRSRRSELVRMGRVRDSGTKGETKSGNKSIIWEIVMKKEESYGEH